VLAGILAGEVEKPATGDTSKLGIVEVGDPVRLVVTVVCVSERSAARDVALSRVWSVARTLWFTTSVSRCPTTETFEERMPRLEIGHEPKHGM
jgi:hypothetical protein